MSESSENNGIPPSNGTDNVPQGTDFAYDWLKSEHSLRDEGSYFGLVDGNTEEKEEAIRQFYDAGIQALRVGIEIDRAAQNLAESEIERLRTRLAQLLVEKASWENPGDYSPHYFFRYLLGFAAYTLMLLFNFGLIYETLGQSSRYPLWLSLGVYLFGMLSLIRKIAIVYTDERETIPQNLSEESRWKIYSEEIGIPVVASIFVVAYGRTATPLHAALIFILITALFLYAGKGFWQSMLHLQQENRIWQNNRIIRRNRAAKIVELEKEIQHTKEMIAQKQQAKSNLELIIRNNTMQMTRAEAQKAAAIHYFKSEFDLARSAKRLGIFG